MTCLLARTALVALYPLRVAVDIILGPDQLGPDYRSPTTESGR